MPTFEEWTLATCWHYIVRFWVCGARLSGCVHSNIVLYKMDKWHNIADGVMDREEEVELEIAVLMYKLIKRNVIIWCIDNNKLTFYSMLSALTYFTFKRLKFSSTFLLSTSHKPFFREGHFGKTNKKSFFLFVKWIEIWPKYVTVKFIVLHCRKKFQFPNDTYASFIVKHLRLSAFNITTLLKYCIQ